MTIVQMPTQFDHVPVLAEESICGLAIKPGGVYVDGTVGGAGHSLMILDALALDSGACGSTLIGIDRDEEAVSVAKSRLLERNEASGGSVRCEVLHANYADIDKICDNLGIAAVDGILLDIGVSSHQFDEAERGFSFRADAPLDMRMDRSSGVSAADIVNGYKESELTRIFREYGEERWAARISKFIVERRERQPVETTGDLVKIILAAVPASARREGNHPARRVFQSVRIAVNDELGALSVFLYKASALMNKGARLCVISFHSLEDRIVKERFKELSAGCVCPSEFPICICGRKAVLSQINRRPIQAKESEILVNPRARSAKLRIAEKL